MARKLIISDDEDDILVEEKEEKTYGDQVDDSGVEEDWQDEHQKDGFIVEDVEEEEEEKEDRVDSDEEREKKKKRNWNFKKTKKFKFKRLKKARGNTEDEDEASGLSDDGDVDVSKKVGHTAEDYISEEDDDMDDFIVEDEENESGAPVRRNNTKKTWLPPGISSALREAHGIFGGFEDLLRIRKLESRDRFSETIERSLEDQFDPSILSEKYMTGKDEQICKIDVPERMQISAVSTEHPPTDDTSINMETEWIFNQIVSGVVPLFNKSGATIEDDELKCNITRFLKLMHVEKLDVPFIAMYCKEEILSLLKNRNEPEADMENEQKPTLKWHKVLWTIQDLDKKWLLLRKRKNECQSSYIKCFEEESRYDEILHSSKKQIFESIIRSLKAADSESEVDDVVSKSNLHFPEILQKGQFKRPERKSHYRICSKAGLSEVTSKFGYSSEQFGLLISLEKMRMDKLEDAKETPEQMASNFTCVMFDTPQAVLKGARHMAAVEISCEPCVLRHVRSIFMYDAVVSTSPTSHGDTAIDPFDQYSGVKWLLDKPLSRFEGEQWFLIQKAEEEKLLQVTIKLPEVVLDKLISDLNDHYLSDGVSKYAQLWNEQRKLILHDAYYNFLLPSMEKEARAFLTGRAKTWLLLDYGKLLWNKVSVSPYQRKENDVNSDEATAPRVMACCWDPRKPATTFVMLDSSGEVLDVLHAGSLNPRGQSINQQQRTKNDQQRVQKFMVDHRPHVVVLGAAEFSCIALKEDIYEIILKMVEDNPRDVGHGMDNLNIVFGDESLPRLYENSRISADQIPYKEAIIRRAVALGRYLQNPLSMVATLCGPGKEILSWKLHPFENFIIPDDKNGMVEQVMVDVTNQVGLDLNLASRHQWLFAPLQFISGLGPSKAAALQRSLVRSGAIFTRNDLSMIHGLGKVVYKNAVAFMRVRRSRCTSGSSQFINLLDDTRIHPESYSLAQDMVKDNYLVDGTDDANVLEHVRENPHVLRSVDVRKYGIEKELLNKIETLNDISLELMEHFQDRRKPYVEPSRDDLFYIISGEAKEVISSGMDPYYHEGRSTLYTAQEEARKEKEVEKKHFKPGMIVHPRFQSLTADEAIEFLSDKDPGESVIRPSSRGPSFFTLTLKVYDGVYANSLVQKDKTLTIGKSTFEDLDEVMDGYVDPLVAHLKLMLNYHKFRRGSKTEVNELLRIEKAENPMRIAYCFGICYERPGTFILTYIRSSDPHHEYIVMCPKGFMFRKQMFEDIDRLVAFFRSHIDDPHDYAPSIQSVAAMVPMRNPATGGSSGFSGGWGVSSNDGNSRGDRDRNSGSRTGSGDYRNGDGHSSGARRPYGGRGYGRGRGGGGGDWKASEPSSRKWRSKDGDNGDGWGDFCGWGKWGQGDDKRCSGGKFRLG